MNFKFAYLSTENPNNKRVWSGTHYSILKHLKTIGTVDILGPYEPKCEILFKRILNQITFKLFNKRIAYRHSTLVAKNFGKYFTEKLKNKTYDFIIAPAASGEIAYLKTKIPIIYITDGTFNGCLNYHKNLSLLTNTSQQEGELIEQLAINKSNLIIASSEWCANSIINHYNKDKNQVVTLPYGANLENIPNSISPKKLNKNDVFKLLFVGVYWENKGGPIVINALNKLISENYKVELTIVGCEPNLILPSGVTVIPFLDKNNNDGQLKMMEIFKSHHALILPTRFDCSPIVINEASAFAMPSLVSNTGGVNGHLTNNVNGFLVDYDDDGSGYAKLISGWINNPISYSNISESTLKQYQNFNNWDKWISELKKILLNLK
ncbi:MAG: glycosyltransferase family 4 protein [Bacteroidetes bacterium]|mgnify:CR=1 FL=1|nr:glycosyltransferase family 4 protein [Bacteroidota bacterium]